MSVPTSESTDLEGLQHKCVGALKELILVAMGCHLVRVTSIPHGPSPQFIDQYFPTVATKPWTIYTSACRTSGEEKRLRGQGLRFSVLTYLQFIKCSWPGFGSWQCALLSIVLKGECNLSCCSTQKRSSSGPHCLCPHSTIADHFWGGDINHI